MKFVCVYKGAPTMLECALTEGAVDRTERMKKRLRRGPATATCTSLLCSRTQQYQYQKIRKNYKLSHLVLAASVFHGCLEYCCRVRTLLSSTSASRNGTEKRLCFECFGCAAAVALGDFWVQSELRDQKCDAPETQEQIFEASGRCLSPFGWNI